MVVFSDAESFREMEMRLGEVRIRKFLKGFSSEDQQSSYRAFYLGYLDAEKRGDDTHMRQCAYVLSELKELWSLSVADIAVFEADAVKRRANAEAFLNLFLGPSKKESPDTVH